MSLDGITRTEDALPWLASATDRNVAAFSVRLHGDAVLTCSGELDPATKPALRRSLRRVVRLAPDRVVVDLSRVSFFDAGTVGELVRARSASRAAGGDLVVRGPSPFGHRVLSIIGLADIVVTELAGEAAPGDDSGTLAGRFAAAHRSSMVLDEAKGLVAEHFDLGIDEAAVVLRAFSIAQHQPVLTTAVALMNRTTTVGRLGLPRPADPVAAYHGTSASASDRAAPRSI